MGIVRLQRRELDDAFERYEAAAREHAFVHAEMLHRIRRGEAPARGDIDAVDTARTALDRARAELKGLFDA
jgi:hypothetical protein